MIARIQVCYYGRMSLTVVLPQSPVEINIRATALDLRAEAERLGDESCIIRSAQDIATDLYAVCERYWAELERTSPIVAEIRPDGDRVWARVYYEITGREVPRKADEGRPFDGPNARTFAALEAEDRAQRAVEDRVERIRRVGYAQEETE